MYTYKLNPESDVKLWPAGSFSSIKKELRDFVETVTAPINNVYCVHIFSMRDGHVLLANHT